MLLNIKNTTFDKSVSIVLAISPILQTYGWPKYDFGFLSIVILYFWWISIRFKRVGIMPKLLNAYLWYYLAAYILGCLMVFRFEFPLGWAKIYLVYLIFFSCIKFKLLKKYYEWVAYTSIIFLFIQVIAFNTAGIKIPGVTSLLPLSFDNLEYSQKYIEINMSNTVRSCSFFSEPARCAQYLLPLLAITLFDRNIKLRYYKVIIICLALLLLKSGNAVYIMTIVFICYMVYSLTTRWSTKKFIFNIIIVVSGAVGSFYYINTESGQELLGRQSEIENNNDGSSGFLRIYRGYALYEAMSPFEKVIGINNKTLMTQAANKSSIASMFGEDDFYFNTVQNILIKTGIIGTILFILLIIYLFRRSSPPGKAIIVGLVLLSFVASMYLSYIMLIYLICAYKMTKSKAINI